MVHEIMYDENGKRIFKIEFKTDNFETFKDVEKRIRIAMDIEKMKEPFKDELAMEENE